tara:strand:+ start:2314 stop:3783 length:1470 start_codon:yes stop_codon:yes gene_type:complete
LVFETGISAKNVTLGIPRLKELLNCTKKMKAPYVTVQLLDPSLEVSSLNEVKVGTYLDSVSLEFNGELAASKDWVQRFQYAFLEERRLPYDKKNWLHMVFDADCPVSMLDVRDVLLDHIPDCVVLCTHDTDPVQELYLYLGDMDLWSREDFNINVEAIKSIHVAGLKGVSGLSIEEGELLIPNTGLTVDLLIELAKVANMETVYTNNIINILETLGIEAARRVLVDEIKNVLSFDGAYVNPRHVNLVGDSITHLGYLRSMSRHGLFRDKRSALSNAAFEMGTVTMCNAAMDGNEDLLKGVAEQIIMGKNSSIGTGHMELFLDESKLLAECVVEREPPSEFTAFAEDEAAKEISTPSISPSDSPDVYSPSDGEFSPQFSPDQVSKTPSAWSPSAPTYTPASPAYAPSSPMYSPSAPAYNPTGVYTPASPAYAPSSPIYSPSSPAYNPTNMYECEYSPASPAYVPSSPTCPKKAQRTTWVEEDLLSEMYSP